MSEPTNAREILARLVGFPSVSRDGNRALVDWVQGWLEGLGIACGRWDAPDGKNASLWAQVGPAVPGGLLLSGHTDVVPVEGQVWTGDPFVLAERDGRLYGRGTTDMKGFDALALAALVGARDLPLKRPLQVVLTHDEEVGCTGAPLVIPFVLADLPKAAAVIVGEPSGLACVTGHKGGIMFDVRVRGFAMHSSLMDRSVSAVMEAARLIGWANAENERLWAARPGPLAAAFDPPFTTLHSGTIRGGTAQNITAQDCRFDLGYRVVPGEDVGAHEARFLAEVARQSAAMTARRPEAGIEAPVAFRVPPLAPEAGGAAEALVRRVTGDNGVHVVSYGTEAGHYQAAGYSAVVCGPGDIAQAHQPDEFITVADFQAGERFVGRLVETLLQ